LFVNGGTPAVPLTNDAYCAWSTPFLTQFKLAAVNTFWWDVQGSVALQSNPGPMVLGTYNAPTPSWFRRWGHNLTSFPSGYPIDLVQPGTQYGDRLNQLDLRFAKIFQGREHAKLQGDAGHL